MQVITPTPSQAAFVLKKYLQEQGVEMKLGQMQEAVARMQGYASWNALTADVAPRGNTPADGALKRTAPGQYTVQEGAPDALFVTVGPVTTRITREAEGVTVDLLSTVDLARTVHAPAIATAYAEFSEAEDEEVYAAENRDPDMQYALYRQVIKELLSASCVLDTMDRPRTEPHPFIYKREALLLRALNEEVSEDAMGIGAFEYKNEAGTRRVFSLAHLKEAEPDGKGGWIMPDEGVAVRFLKGSSSDDRRALTTTDLLKELLNADRVSLFYPDGCAAEDMKVEHVSKPLVDAYLARKRIPDVRVPVMRYRIAGKETYDFPLGDLIGAHSMGDGKWLLLSGLQLQMHPAEK